MKQKVAAFFLVFCLFSSFAVSDVSADVQKNQVIDDVYSIYEGPGGPIEVMPPQY